MRLTSLFCAIIALVVVADTASATVVRQRVIAPRRAVVVAQPVRAVAVVQPVVVRQRLVAPLSVVQPVYGHAVVQQVVQPVYAQQVVQPVVQQYVQPVQQVQQVQQYTQPVLQVVQPVVVRPRLAIVSPYCQ